MWALILENLLADHKQITFTKTAAWISAITGGLSLEVAAVGVAVAAPFLCNVM